MTGWLRQRLGPSSVRLLGRLIPAGIDRGIPKIRNPLPVRDGLDDQPARGSNASAAFGGGRFVPYRRRPGLLLLAVLGAAAGVVYFAIESSAPNQSRLVRIPPMDATPGGTRQQDSERYRETLRSANDLNADLAGRSGTSYISVPEGVPEQAGTPADQSSLPWLRPTAESEPSVQAPAFEASGDLSTPHELSGRAGESDSHDRDSPTGRMPLQGESSVSSEENPYKSAMLAQMSAISRTMTVHPPKSVEFAVDLNEAASRESGSRSLSGANEGGPDASQPEADGWTIPAGTILQAEMVNSVSSDHASPIVARVNSGRFQGAHLTGSFTVASGSDGLFVEFGQLNMPDGASVPVRAIAIDGVSADAAVASDTEHRFAERYLPTLMASFVSGFADSVATTPQVISSLNGWTMISSSEPSHRESLHAGLRDAAALVASDIAATAPRGPKIKLEAGHPLGVLFVGTATNGDRN